MQIYSVQPLPPSVNLETVAILKALNKASRALGELKGELSKIPNAQILIDTLVLQEAKDSNAIENIVTTGDEMYQASIDEKVSSDTAREALNYGSALKEGFRIVQEKGVLINTDIQKIQALVSPNHPIRKIPGTVLKNPTTEEVVFTPPQDYNEILELLSNFEKYVNDASFHEIDSLIKMPVIHYQFESIHPFYDGNGRTGRLINMLYLVHQNLLNIPVLYLSSYIVRNKSDYYRLLQEVRINNAWEEWIVWMLKGVEQTSRETIVVVHKIHELMNAYKVKIRDNCSFYSHDLINILFKHPYTKIENISKELKVHRNTASSYLKKLCELGVLVKNKRGKQNYYINVQLLKILEER